MVSHRLFFLSFLVHLGASQFTFLNCTTDDFFQTLPSVFKDAYPWNSYVYKFIGPPDTNALIGSIGFPSLPEACEPLPPDSDVKGKIVFVRDGRCSPEIKSTNIFSAGGIGIVVYHRLSNVLQRNRLNRDGHVPTFALERGVMRRSDDWDEEILIQAIRELVEREPSCTIQILPQTYQVAYSAMAAWIAFSVFICIFSVANVFLCVEKLIRYFRSQGETSKIAVAVLSIECCCNLVRILFSFEPFPLGNGLYPFWLWAFFATSTLMIDLCATFMTACYWKHSLHNSEINFFRICNLSAMKLTFSIVVSVVLLIDFTNTFLRMFLFNIEPLNVSTGIFYLAITSSFAAYFIYVGVQTIRTVARMKGSPSQHLTRYVFTNASGQILFFIGIVCVISDTNNLAQPDWWSNFLAFAGISIISLSQITVFRNPSENKKGDSASV